MTGNGFGFHKGTGNAWDFGGPAYVPDETEMEEKMNRLASAVDEIFERDGFSKCSAIRHAVITFLNQVTLAGSGVVEKGSINEHDIDGHETPIAHSDALAPFAGYEASVFIMVHPETSPALAVQEAFDALSPRQQMRFIEANTSGRDVATEPNT